MAEYMPVLSIWTSRPNAAGGSSATSTTNASFATPPQPPSAPGGWAGGVTTLAAPILIAGSCATVVYAIASRIVQARRTHAQARGRKPDTDEDTDDKNLSATSSPVVSPTDESVARFCKMEELGRGAFGVVYKGRHYRTGELVAIKEMPAVNCEELRTEFQLMVGLKHENIVNVIAFDVGHRHARLYLEWVAGGSLADMIKRFPIDEVLARQYVKQILSGLSFLHHHNIIHRDIKPKNILIDHRGTLKLTDFGLSRHLDSMHDRTRAAGTPVYMSPESVKGHFSAASDIWAVGATLSEMLTRQIPWSHVDPLILQNQMALLYHIATYQDHKGHHPVIPRTTSAECQRFMETCFAADPAQRLTCDALLQHAWFSTAVAENSDDVALHTTGSSLAMAEEQISVNGSPSSQRESTTTFSQKSAVSK